VNATSLRANPGANARAEWNKKVQDEVLRTGRAPTLPQAALPVAVLPSGADPSTAKLANDPEPPAVPKPLAKPLASPHPKNGTKPGVVATATSPRPKGP
jgi:hypothetical protein